MTDRPTKDRIDEAVEAINEIAAGLGLDIELTITDPFSRKAGEEVDEDAAHQPLPINRISRGQVTAITTQMMRNGLVRRRIRMRFPRGCRVNWITTDEPESIPDFKIGDWVIASIAPHDEE